VKALVFFLMLVPFACSAAEIDYLKINLMQQRELILQKMDGIEGMSRYIKATEVDIHKKLSGLDAAPAWGYLVIAVRNDGKIKAWVDSDDQIAPPVQKTMIDVAEGTQSFHVKSGAVVFALGFGINGADIPPNVMPFPDEWKRISKCRNEACQDQSAEEIVLKSWK
jgi:hypothetical protein